MKNKIPSNDNLRDEVFLKTSDVKKTLKEGPYERNEVLYNLIYYEKKLSINKLAKLLGVNRQYIWGILNRRLYVSFSMARKLCDVLGVKEIKTLFRDGDLYYPNFKTADQYHIDASQNTTERRNLKNE